MAAKLDLPDISRFDPAVDHSSIGPRWQAWREELDYYIAAANITNDKQKRNILLHLAGPKVQKIFKTLREPEEERTFKSASDALDDYFLPKKNVVCERLIFGEAVQEPHESIDQFATRLRNLSDHCQFENVDDAVRDQLVKACLSTKLKKFALREGSREGGQCDLKSLLDFERAQERGESKARQMNNGNSSNNDLGHVYAVNSRKKDGRVKAQQTFKKNASEVRQTAAAKPKKCCFYCGRQYPHSTVALHKERLVGLARRLDILQVFVVQKEKDKWWKKLCQKFNSLI